MISFRQTTAEDASAIYDLFRSTFTDSEGADEGELVGNLARDLMSTTQAEDLAGFVACEHERIVGSIFFSRLTFAEPIEGFLLAPVAVATDQQGQGIGQALIQQGLAEMKQRSVVIVVTYGDPAFYSKVGFQPLSTRLIEPPYPLSLPHGWIGQSLLGGAIEQPLGQCHCVRAFDVPSLW